MLMKKLLAALVFVGFLTGGVAAPIGIEVGAGNLTVVKTAQAQTTKPEEGKKGKEGKKKEKKPKKEKKEKKQGKKNDKEKKGKDGKKKTEG
jgi:hypothetical protein